jgi:hypothetical protein
MRRAVLLVALVALAVPGSALAAKRHIYVPRAGVPLRIFTKPMRDRILTGAAAVRADRLVAQAGTIAQVYRTADGYPVTVQLSPSYATDPNRAAAFVAFLGTRLHGAEMGKLFVYIATTQEIGTACGVEALACYDPRQNRMTVSGDPPGPGQPPTEFVVSHEYGHHVANNRSNAPWPAGLFGPKRWATLERVCTGWQAGALFPGDEDKHYFSNPGEAWAESFAFYHFQNAGFPWRWLPALQPGPPAYAAMEADVKTPWTRNVHRRFQARFGRGGRNTHRFTLKTTLDGVIVAKLSKPRSLKTTIVVKLAGQTVERTHGTVIGGQHHERIDCGWRKATFTVVRRSGAGRIRLRVTYAG